MSQDQQAQNLEFLRRNINHLEFEEIERYAWLAGATGLQSMAVRAQDYIADEEERIRHDAAEDGRNDGLIDGQREIRDLLKKRLATLQAQTQRIAEEIRQHADTLAEDARRHAKVIDEKAGELNDQLDLLGSAL